MAGTRIFLAGGSGMVGRAILSRLALHAPGTKCRASVFSQEDFPLSEGMELVRGDLRSSEVCSSLCRGCEIAIVAAATTGGIAQNKSEPWRQVNDNLFLNAQLLEAFHREGIRRVIMIGTATCYQPFDGLIKEDGLDWSQDPHHHYMGVGWVSRFLEKLCQFWHQKTGIETIFVRAANVFGPFAKFDPATSNFIPALIRKAESKPEELKVWGSAAVKRDVIYVDDFADAILALLAADNIRHDIFNLGTSSATTVGEVVDVILQKAGMDARSVSYDETETAVPNRILDCTRLREATDWYPTWQTKDAIHATFDWWVENKNRWKR